MRAVAQSIVLNCDMEEYIKLARAGFITETRLVDLMSGEQYFMGYLLGVLTSSENFIAGEYTLHSTDSTYH